MIPLLLKWKIAQYFESRWWKRYLRNKSKEDYLAWKSNYWHEFLKHAEGIVSFNQSLNILDVGCGPAGIFMVLKPHHVDAVDPLLYEYEKLPHFRKSDYTHVYFIQSKLEDYRKESHYDVVFCLNAINHVDDLQASLINLAASLKPNGTLFLSVDAQRFLPLKYLFRLIPGDILHPHQLMLEDYVVALEKENLKVEKTELIKRGGVFDYYLIIAKNIKV